MKRATAILLILAILFSASALADRAPSAAAITVDGVRTAFFDESGAYLPPVEENGLVFVPVLSLAESLQLDVKADAATLAVTVNGVRTAFFDDAGAYLPPLLENGAVYVPLRAFAQSAGVSLTVEATATPSGAPPRPRRPLNPSRPRSSTALCPWGWITG